MGDWQAGLLPPVCVKSGKPTDSKLTFHFGPSSTWMWFFLGGLAVLAGRSGPLPVTKYWRTTFIVFRFLAMALAALATIVWFSVGAQSDASRAGWAEFGLGCFVSYVIAHTLYAGLRPKAYLYRAHGSRLWVQLHNAHPNFVAAVEAMENDQTDVMVVVRDDG